MNTPSTTASPPIDYRSLVRRVLLATLLGAAVFAGLSIYSDVRQLRQNLQSFAPSAFAVALLLAAGNYAVRIVRWQYYLKLIGVSIPRLESALVFLAGFVLSVTPGKLGEAFKSLMLYESRGVSVARTVPVVIAERLTDLIGLVILIAFGSLSFKHGISITIASAAMVAFLVAACTYRPLGEFFLSVAARIRFTKRLVAKLREAYDALYEMTLPVPLAIGTVVATIAWGLECAALYYIIKGLGSAVLGWRATIFAYSTSTIAGAIAMMPGGLGVTEVGMTGLIQALGKGQISAATAAAATILVRIATLWFAVGLGFLALAARRLLRN
jgi:glycosyltransferase 2 family protein